MNTARIIVGANYGDEGKGTVTAHYAKHSANALNILTNGGAQRGHSIVSEHGSHTFQHFGSGTYYGAANYYSRFFILNPMQFAKEYEALVVKPSVIYRHEDCRWTTPYDMMANAITEELQKRHASCGMGIWNTIKRYRETGTRSFDSFCDLPVRMQIEEMYMVKAYYDRKITIPELWKHVWDSQTLIANFLYDCKFMREHTTPNKDKDVGMLAGIYKDLIFENGQGLLLCDTGKDTADTTPSDTGLKNAISILKDMGVMDENGKAVGDSIITAHYVTRPYLTRHGDGGMENESKRAIISDGVAEDRTNHYNQYQGIFRYGKLDIGSLKERIEANAGIIPYEIELTHCDEMDRVGEFKQMFDTINVYDKPEIE